MELSTSLRMLIWLDSDLTIRDDNDYIMALSIRNNLLPFKFESNDNVMRYNASVVTSNLLEQLKKDNLFDIDEHHVICNRLNNTFETIDLGKLIVSVAVRLKNSKEFYFNVSI